LRDFVVGLCSIAFLFGLFCYAGQAVAEALHKWLKAAISKR
jgi:hypothetical protein